MTGAVHCSGVQWELHGEHQQEQLNGTNQPTRRERHACVRLCAGWPCFSVCACGVGLCVSLLTLRVALCVIVWGMGSAWSSLWSLGEFHSITSHRTPDQQPTQTNKEKGRERKGGAKGRKTHTGTRQQRNSQEEVRIGLSSGSRKGVRNVYGYAWNSRVKS